ncbi:MAG TPA: DUF3168 domain-containing protein [Elusimicrobiales bacterium]|nr:DUF3168 domain-containing protein [Elusimicrobiales bacterium]
MTAEQILYDVLRQTAAVAALVGDRIYPVRLPDEVILPAMTYLKASCIRYASHGGPSRLSSARFQLDCYSADYLDAKRLALAAVAALHGKKGGNIQAAFNENETDGFSPDNGIYRVTADVLIWHREEL